MESLFIQLQMMYTSQLKKKKTLTTGLVVQGHHTHIYCNFNLNGCFLISQAYSLLVDREVGYCQGQCLHRRIATYAGCLLMN